MYLEFSLWEPILSLLLASSFGNCSRQTAAMQVKSHTDPISGSYPRKGVENISPFLWLSS